MLRESCQCQRPRNTWTAMPPWPMPPPATVRNATWTLGRGPPMAAPTHPGAGAQFFRLKKIAFSEAPVWEWCNFTRKLQFSAGVVQFHRKPPIFHREGGGRCATLSTEKIAFSEDTVWELCIFMGKHQIFFMGWCSFTGKHSFS